MIVIGTTILGLSVLLVGVFIIYQFGRVINYILGFKFDKEFGLHYFMTFLNGLFISGLVFAIIMLANEIGSLFVGGVS